MVLSPNQTRSTIQSNGSRSMMSSSAFNPTATPGGTQYSADMSSSMSMITILQKPKFVPKQVPRFRLSCQAGKMISKTRWLKTEHGGLIPDALVPEYFITGSWGELENEISLWRLNVGEAEGDEPLKADIRLLKKHPIPGSVHDMVIVSDKYIALTTSLGAVSMYKIDVENQAGVRSNIKHLFTKELHRTLRSQNPTPATGIAVNDKSIVTVGEDGSIFELNADNFELVQSLRAVDQLSLCSVEYTASHTIATGNNGGQVKIYDLQSGENKPMKTLNRLEDLSSAISIARHPTQSHIILVGYASGGTDLWDLRGSSSEPIANLQKQDGGVTEIFFHPMYPDNFYTCSQNGEVIHYFTGENISQSEILQSNDYSTDLNLEFLKYGLSMKTLYSSPFPINSMNLSSNNRLICGGDSGIVFCTENV